MNLGIVSPGVSASITQILNPEFKGIPDARTLAKYLLRALITIKKNNLQVKVYLSQEVTGKIGNILVALGVKFKTIPASKMEPPYIFITMEDNYVVVKTVDTSGREIASYKAPFTKFIEAFESFFNSYKKKRTTQKEKNMESLVDEVILSPENLEKFLKKYKHILEEEES